MWLTVCASFLMVAYSLILQYSDLHIRYQQSSLILKLMLMMKIKMMLMIIKHQHIICSWALYVIIFTEGRIFSTIANRMEYRDLTVRHCLYYSPSYLCTQKFVYLEADMLILSLAQWLTRLFTSPFVIN